MLYQSITLFTSNNPAIHLFTHLSFSPFLPCKAHHLNSSPRPLFLPLTPNQPHPTPHPTPPHLTIIPPPSPLPYSVTPLPSPPSPTISLPFPIPLLLPHPLSFIPSYSPALLTHPPPSLPPFYERLHAGPVAHKLSSQVVNEAHFPPSVLQRRFRHGGHRRSDREPWKAFDFLCGPF